MDAIDDELSDTHVLNGPYVPTKLTPTTDDPNKVAFKQRIKWT